MLDHLLSEITYQFTLKSDYYSIYRYTKPTDTRVIGYPIINSPAREKWGHES